MFKNSDRHSSRRGKEADFLQNQTIPMKGAKILLIGMFLGLCCPNLSANSYTNLVAGPSQVASLYIRTGEVARVLSGKLATPSKLTVTLNGSNFDYLPGDFSGSSPSAGYIPGPPIISGPATLTLVCNSSSPAFCSVELKGPTEQLMPSTAVVIPADSGGPVNIILESSTDMITWTGALPGTYGTSTTNRFFRVRAERTP